MRALSLEIMKHKGMDCSNHGISSRFDEILLLCDEGNVEVNGNEPNLCKLVKRNLFGNETYYHVEPVERPSGAGWMSGGTVVYTCDSRFRTMGNGYPLSLHDRQESWEMYERFAN